MEGRPDAELVEEEARWRREKGSAVMTAAGEMSVEGRAGLKSRDARGVPEERSEKVRDFRRARGKKPSVRRGMRAISMGSVECGRRTQESCFHGGSASV